MLVKISLMSISYIEAAGIDLIGEASFFKGYLLPMDHMKLI